MVRKKSSNGQLNVLELIEKESSTFEKKADFDDIGRRLKANQEKSVMLGWPHGLSVNSKEVICQPLIPDLFHHWFTQSTLGGLIVLNHDEHFSR